MKLKSHIRHLSVFIMLCFTINLLCSTTAQATYTTTESQNELIWPNDGPDIIAESAIVMDANTGLILYEKNKDEKLYPASITKIMTTLLALENSSLSDVITFSKEAVFSIEAGSSHIGVNPGEQLTMEQALYAIMLASANEVSAGVGEYIAGSLDGFPAMMNAKAKELGCLNTNFMNAHGLHDDNHYTTAYDMALISKAALQNKTFRTIASTKRYEIPPTEKYPEVRYLNNHHQMLYANKYPQYKYEYCTGGKTGYTIKAGNTLVTFAEKDGMELICVIMKSQNPLEPKNQYTDTISLLNYAFENYKLYNISKENNAVLLDETSLFTRFNVLFNSSDSPLSTTAETKVLIPNNATIEDIQQTIEYYNDINLKPGKNIIGSIHYTYGDQLIGSTDVIYTIEETPTLTTSNAIIEKEDGLHPIQSLFTNDTNNNNVANPLFLLPIILLIILILFVTLKMLQRRRRKKQYEYRRKKRLNSYHNYNKFD